MLANVRPSINLLSFENNFEDALGESVTPSQERLEIKIALNDQSQCESRVKRHDICQARIFSERERSPRLKLTSIYRWGLPKRVLSRRRDKVDFVIMGIRSGAF